MKFPTIHLNGTSGERLIEAWDEAYSALAEAQRKLAQAAPNARDYYVQEPGAFQVAQDEHFWRLNKLQEVQKDLEALIENVSTELARRAARK